MALGHDVQKNPGDKMWFVFSTQCEGKFLQLMKADTICVLSCSTPKASLLARPDVQRASACRRASLTAPGAAPSLLQHGPSPEHSEPRWPKPLLWSGAGPGVAQSSCFQRWRLPAQGGEVEQGTSLQGTYPIPWPPCMPGLKPAAT